MKNIKSISDILYSADITAMEDNYTDEYFQAKAFHEDGIDIIRCKSEEDINIGDKLKVIEIIPMSKTTPRHSIVIKVIDDNDKSNESFIII